MQKKDRKEKREMSLRAKLLLLFFLLLFSRVILSLVYLTIYGSHTTPIPETYFYYGVSRMRLALEPYDITGWILKGVATLFPEEYLLYGVFFAGSLISSFTALMVFFFVRDEKDERTAMTASLLYGFLVEPLSMGVLLFTHDLVQMPFFIAFLATFWRAVKRRSLKFAVIAAIIFLIATRINATIFIALEIAIIAGLFLMIEKKEKYYAYLFYLIGAFFFLSCVLFISGVIGNLIPPLLEVLSSVSKYNYESLFSTYLSGTADFAPPSLFAFWIRYNAFLFMIPPALSFSFKKKDLLFLSVFFVAAVSSLFFDRATRILDLGMALMVGNFIFSEEAKGVGSHVSVIAVVFVFLMFMLGISSPFFLFLPIVILVIWVIAMKREEHERTIFTLGLLLINAVFLLAITGAPPISEAEYESYRFLEGKEGTVSSDWGRGFAIKAIANLEPEASPANLSDFYQKVLMKEEEVATREMRGKGIRYVIVTNQYFKFSGGEVRASDFFLKYYSGRSEELGRTLLFRMLFDDEKLSSFRKVFEKRDMATNTIVKVFLLEDTMTIKIIEKVI